MSLFNIGLGVTVTNLPAISRQEQRHALEALEHWSWGDYERDDDTHDAEAESVEPEAAEAAEVEPPGGLGAWWEVIWSHK